MREAVERYFRDVRDIHRSGGGVQETSYYGSLEALLNEVGRGLTPKVRCIIHVKNVGAGIPDGGLFTADQVQGVEGERPTLLDVPIPARGVIEVKGAKDELDAIAHSDQVRGYLKIYGQVLVTNLRGFLLVERGDDGAPRLGERYLLAAGEHLFWQAVEDPATVWEEHGEPFWEYLKRMLLMRAPLTEPRFLAFFLASYARTAAARLERTGAPGLGALRGALEQALGLRFQGEKGEHFFRSTLVQTLFYGLFSAWVLWSKEQKAGTKAQFDWKDTGHLLHVPAISALFHQISYAGTLRRLGLTETLEWAGAALNRVEREAFFARFEEDAAVQYFYEPFLEAFDPELRKQLGVWYTPPEVVEYMVARVDAVLKEELGLRDGLADPKVHVLDPCTGTGSYLVAVLRRIHRTLQERGEDALLGNDLKRAAIERIRGFEISAGSVRGGASAIGVAAANDGRAAGRGEGGAGGGLPDERVDGLGRGRGRRRSGFCRS